MLFCIIAHLSGTLTPSLTLMINRRLTYLKGVG